MKPTPIDELLDLIAEITAAQEAEPAPKAESEPKPDDSCGGFLVGYLSGIHAVSGHLLSALRK